MDHAFGQGDPFTVGLEEELLLVDRGTHGLAHSAAEVLGAIELPEGASAHEAYASEIELRSPPAADAAGASAHLERGRVAARAAGATLMGVGVHPDGALGDAALVEAERYRRVLEEMRGLIQRTPECALHVHVGMPDADSAIRAFNGMRAWLPLLAGLAAASPFWFGADSGLATARAALVRAYPGRGVPAPLRDLDDYERTLADVALGGGPDDYTLLWWDVRLHPRFGTLEIREMDAQSRLRDVVALAALVQGLAAYEAGAATAAVPSEAIRWSWFRATRDGLDARILHRDRPVPLREAAIAAIALARGHLDDEGAAALEGIDRIVREGNGADRQRAAFRDGGMEALLRYLVEETAAPL